MSPSRGASSNGMLHADTRQNTTKTENPTIATHMKNTTIKTNHRYGESIASSLKKLKRGQTLFLEAARSRGSCMNASYIASREPGKLFTFQRVSPESLGMKKRSELKKYV